MSKANEVNDQELINDIAQKAIEQYLTSEPSILDKIELCKLKAIVINMIQQYFKNFAKMIPNNQTVAVYDYLRKKLAIEGINNFCYGYYGESPDFPKNLVEEAASILIVIEDNLIEDDYQGSVRDALRQALSEQERRQNE